MKYFVFICALVFVESFPLEDKEDFIGHDAAVEIHNDGDELNILVRNKRQFSPFQPSGGSYHFGGQPPLFPPPSNNFNFHSMPLPSTNYNSMPPINLGPINPPPPPPSPYSGSVFGGGSTVGGRVNYDLPRAGGSVMGVHNFEQPHSRLGVEGRYHIINDGKQKLSVMAGYEGNVGPVPVNPSGSVGVTYQRALG